MNLGKALLLGAIGVALGAAVFSYLQPGHSPATARDEVDTSEPRSGGVIRVAISSDILSTNPGVRRDGNTDTVLWHIGEGLVAFRDDMTVAPMLAERVDVSSDGLTYVFTLRDDVTFHNGARLTSAEVLWTWNRLLTPETGFRCLDDFDGSGATGIKIETIQADGPYRVVFRLNRPSRLFLERMSNAQCQTSIMHPDSVDAAGAWSSPIGTGPYRLDSWRRGRDVTLARFDNYAARTEAPSGLAGRKIAYADKIIFVVSPDLIAATSALYAGTLDLVFAAPLAAAGEMTRRETRRGDVRLYRQDTLDWTVLLMQVRDPLLADVRLRRAIAHAIAPDIVTELSTYGYGRSNPSAVAMSSRFHSATFQEWLSYDPEKARELAIEAGYAGQELRIQTNRKFSYMYDNAVAIQAMLTAAGFDARIEVLDWASQLSNFIKGDFQLSAFGYSSRAHPALLYGTFTGSKDVRRSYQWENPRAIALIAEMESAGSDAEMEAILVKLHQLMMDDVPLIGLDNDPIVDISRAEIHGYKPWSMGRPRLWGVWVSPERAS